MLTREESQQDQFSTFGRALASMRTQREVLLGLLEETRKIYVKYGAEYRGLQQKQVALEAEVAELQIEASATRNSDTDVKLTALRDEESTIRQRQEWLSEKLVETQASYRKMRSVVQQQEDIIGYLASDMGSDQDTDDNTTQLSRIKLLQAQEDERRRLAREIHDGPAQVLANAIFELEYCDRLWEKNPEQMREEMVRLKQDLRDSLTDVRYFISDLRPVPLSELGLSPVLRRYLDDYQSRFGIKITADLQELERMPAHQELAIFRIIQETLQNTRKHSGAQEVEIGVSRDAESTQIKIADNGSGFDVESVHHQEGQHFGLTSMTERARLIRAELQITSGDEGTMVTLVVPRIGDSSDI